MWHYILRHPNSRSKPLKTCCYIDAVAKDVSVVNGDVAYINADTEIDPANFRNGRVALGHGALNFHAATGRVDRARKFDQRTVTRGLDDPAATFRDLEVDQFATASLERCESAFLVIAYQARTQQKLTGIVPRLHVGPWHLADIEMIPSDVLRGSKRKRTSKVGCGAI
jgi:hypothetical protein